MKKQVVSILGAGVLAFGVIGVATATPIITDGLVAAYEFNGNANDSAGTNNGTVSGATLTTDRHGNVDNAYFFDGVDDHIDINPVFNGDQDPLTYTAWINLDPNVWDPNNDVSAIFGEYTSGGATRNYFRVDSLESGTIGLDQYPPSSSNASWTGRIDVNLNNLAGQWVHVALTMESDTVSGYLNGTFVGSSIFTETYTGNTPTVASIGGRIIGGNWNNGSTFEGALDEVYLYDRALSSSEINQLYTSTAPVPEPATMLLFGTGLVGLVGTRLRRNKK